MRIQPIMAQLMSHPCIPYTIRNHSFLTCIQGHTISFRNKFARDQSIALIYEPEPLRRKALLIVPIYGSVEEKLPEAVREALRR